MVRMQAPTQENRESIANQLVVLACAVAAALCVGITEATQKWPDWMPAWAERLVGAIGSGVLAGVVVAELIHFGVRRWVADGRSGD